MAQTQNLTAWEHRILTEINEHAAFWNSDMAKRSTVEKHLKAKGCPTPSAWVDTLIRKGILRVPKLGYIAVTKKE